MAWAARCWSSPRVTRRCRAQSRCGQNCPLRHHLQGCRCPRTCQSCRVHWQQSSRQLPLLCRTARRRRLLRPCHRRPLQLRPARAPSLPCRPMCRSRRHRSTLAAPTRQAAGHHHPPPRSDIFPSLPLCSRCRPAAPRWTGRLRLRLFDPACRTTRWSPAGLRRRPRPCRWPRRPVTHPHPPQATMARDPARAWAAIFASLAVRSPWATVRCSMHPAPTGVAKFWSAAIGRGSTRTSSTRSSRRWPPVHN